MCIRLWREYADATTRHVKLDGELRRAALVNDFLAIEALTRKVEGAGTLREAAREAIRQHEATAHPASDAASA